MEIDRSKLRLSEGSKWDGDSIVDGGDYPTEITVDAGRLNTDTRSLYEGGSCSVLDALAVIRANGLDPEYEALVLLVTALRGDTFGLSESGSDVHEALERAENLLGNQSPSVEQELAVTPVQLYASLHTIGSRSQT